MNFVPPVPVNLQMFDGFAPFSHATNDTPQSSRTSGNVNLNQTIQDVNKNPIPQVLPSEYFPAKSSESTAPKPEETPVPEQPPGKRIRPAYSNAQLLILEKAFRNDKNPSKPERTELATRLAVPERKIDMWFQNRRMKDRKAAGTKKAPVPFDIFGGGRS